MPINLKKIKEDGLIPDIDKIILEEQKDEFFVDEGEVIFEKNKNLFEAFRYLEKKLKGTEAERKNYMHLIGGLVNKILKKRINLMTFEFMEPFICYHFEFKVISFLAKWTFFFEIYKGRRHHRSNSSEDLK